MSNSEPTAPAAVDLDAPLANGRWLRATAITALVISSTSALALLTFIVGSPLIPTAEWSGWWFLSALIGAFVGGVMGHVALSDIKRGYGSGRRIAKAAMITGYIASLGTIALIIIVIIGMLIFFAGWHD